MNRNPKLIFQITLCITIVSLVLFSVAIVKSWFGEAAGVGAEFCEAARPGLIKQPVNTFSNIGFIAAGLLMAWQLSAGTFIQNNNALARSVFYGTFFSCLVVLLGPGSMAMHATTSKVGGFFDMLSMYLVASFITAYSMQRFFSWQPVHFVIVFIAVLLICLWANFQDYKIIFNFFGNTAFAFFIACTTIFEFLNHYVRGMKHKRAWGFGALISLLFALSIWNLSKTGAPCCDPSSFVQGHAIWHLLDAFAVYCLFRFYVSCDSPPPSWAK